MNDVRVTLEKGLVVYLTGTVEYTIMGEPVYHAETMDIEEGTALELAHFAGSQGGVPEIEKRAAEVYEKMYG
jgi:hypothetical protein